MGCIHMISKLISVFLILLCLSPFLSCENRKTGTENNQPPVFFNIETLKIPDGGVRKLRGQVLYMPIYSNIPYTEKKKYDLSAFLAVHNTDLTQKIKITKVTLFNTNGMVVKNFLLEEHLLNPFATAIFTIPRQDQSGTGANFLVEWIAEQPVNEPLIESVMKDLSGNLGISFLSPGKVIREIQ
jgi:hypothetical protein